MLQLYKKKNQGKNEHSDIVAIKGIIRTFAGGLSKAGRGRRNRMR